PQQDSATLFGPKACTHLKEELRLCLLLSDCVKRDRRTPLDCLRDPKADVPAECQAARYNLFICRREQLDNRNRFRGKKGTDTQQKIKTNNKEPVAMPNVFATVGTTSFDALIRRLDSPELHKILCDQLGYHGLVMQIGRGDYEPVAHTARDYPLEGRFSVSYYRFKPSLAADIAAAGLVISHAGAGSVLESLNAGKRLLVVVNDDLMHNHQTELAHRVAR
uniref:UDP-N-acetylglucosamine transferase subunit ALG13 n=1 Tax=Macrostomum lignano TaxID=282301 RepID=A0A1I8GDK6_9PLAT